MWLLLLGVLASGHASNFSPDGEQQQRRLTETCTWTSWHTFGSAAGSDGINSGTALDNNGWTRTNADRINFRGAHSNFPTSPDWMTFFSRSSDAASIEKPLPGSGFVRVRYGNVYSGTTNVEVGGVNVGAAVNNGDVTTEVGYTNGDTIKIIEEPNSVANVYSVANVWSIDVYICDTPPPTPTTCTRWHTFGSAAGSDGINSGTALDNNGWTRTNADRINFRGAHSNFPTSPDWMTFFSGSSDAASIEKPLPGSGFVRVRYGNVYSGTTNVEVGGVNVGSVVSNGDVTTVADFTIGDTIKIIEELNSVANMWSIDICTPVAQPTNHPVPSPTKAPVPSPTQMPAAGPDGACFHGNGSVLLESGASKPFSELSLGDVIKTSDGEGQFSFNPVLTLPHANNTEPAAFLTLTTETGKKVDMTSDHLIPKCDLEEVTAGELVVGDCLFTVDGKETLIEISSTAKNGVFTAITQDKFIVVDGIVASPFSMNSDPSKPELDYEKYRLELELSRSRKLARMKKHNKRLRGLENSNSYYHKPM